MSNLWNLLTPLRTGIVKMAGSGGQLFGTVIKHGLNNKTITVRVSAQHWNSKYKVYLRSHRNKLVHDQLNYCVTGDKVLIQSCKKLTPRKSYYVKTIVKPWGRDQFDRSAPPIQQIKEQPKQLEADVLQAEVVQQGQIPVEKVAQPPKKEPKVKKVKQSAKKIKKTSTKEERANETVQQRLKRKSKLKPGMKGWIGKKLTLKEKRYRKKQMQKKRRSRRPNRLAYR